MATFRRTDFVALSQDPNLEYTSCPLYHVHSCPDVTVPSFPVGPLLRDTGVCDEAIPFCCVSCGPPPTNPAGAPIECVTQARIGMMSAKNSAGSGRCLCSCNARTATHQAISTSNSPSSKSTTRRFSTWFGTAASPCTISATQ